MKLKGRFLGAPAPAFGDDGRPREVDNSALQSDVEGELRRGLEEGADYVVWPKAVGDLFGKWYGGGVKICL